MFKSSILAAAVVALSATSAVAGTLKANYPVCVTEDLTKQVFMAAEQRDVDALAWLSQNGCMMSKAGLHVTLIERDGMGAYSHVRIYRGKHAVEAWTYSQAVED